jgi:hypothetical protein
MDLSGPDIDIKLKERKKEFFLRKSPTFLILRRVSFEGKCI